MARGRKRAPGSLLARRAAGGASWPTSRGFSRLRGRAPHARARDRLFASAARNAEARGASSANERSSCESLLVSTRERAFAWQARVSLDGTEVLPAICMLG